MNPRDVALAPGQLEVAAVMILDLVKHSIRPKSEVQRIQAIVEDAFSRASKNLDISQDAVWRYTGDGYVCTLLGRSVSRLLDFLNASIPSITRQLDGFSQQIRVGVDYGLLQMYNNQLTLCKEHFDQPGIQAARLENAAGSNEVLCGLTVYQVFSPLYPASFDSHPRRVESKDRVLEAYAFRPVDFSQVRSLISKLFYGVDDNSDALAWTPLKVLVVDDEPFVLETISMLLKCDKHQFTTANSANEALRLLKDNSFDVVITDFAMPGMSGEELATSVKCINPMMPILLVSGYVEYLMSKNEPLPAIDFLLAKPFSVHELRRALFWIMAATSNPAMRQVHGGLCRGGLILKLNAAIDDWQHIISAMSSGDDLAHIMVRHKAKHLASQYIESLHPGNNVIASTTQFCNQLSSLNRITNRVESTWACLEKTDSKSRG